MADPITIGLDIGTTNCKALALTQSGQVVADGDGGYSLLTGDGQAVQRPAEVWAGVIQALNELTAALDDQRVEALCLSGAMHTLLPTKADGEPLGEALTYADGRADAQVRALQQRPEAGEAYRRTGCPLQAIYHPARLGHFAKRDPALMARAQCWPALKDWVGFQLTGHWATDVNYASTTGLLDIHRLAWDEQVLGWAGIEASKLPELIEPTGRVGRVTAAAAQATGLPEGLPVIGGGSDGALANVGAGAATTGVRVVTVGTSGAVRAVSATPLLDPAGRTWCYVLLPGLYLAGGAINNGGLTLQRVRDLCYGQLSPEHAYRLMDHDAATIPPGADGVLLLPYFSGERSPHWQADARAALTSLRLHHTRAHIARAALEGIAFCLADVWQALDEAQQSTTGRQAASGTRSAGCHVRSEPDGPDAPPVRLTGGVTRSPIFRQILADVLGVPIQPVLVGDASALGAAIMAHLALGHIDRLSDLRPPPDEEQAVTPDPATHALYQERRDAFDQAWKLAVLASEP